VPLSTGVQWAAMKPLPPLHLAPRRSRLATAMIVASHAATAALLLALPLPAVARLGGAGGVGLACVWTLWRAIGRSAPVLLRVGVDGRIAVTAPDGSACDGDILADSYVGDRLTTVVWLPDGARRVRTLMVAADTFSADDFRRLRVALRYGRAAGEGPETSGVDAG
jgi:hypothetical protein